MAPVRWHAHESCWLKKTSAVACNSVGYEPKVAWVGAMSSLTLRRSRRSREETADERLDRLIGLELRARAAERGENQAVPELRRLHVEQGGRPSGSGLAVADREQPEGRPEDAVEGLVPLFDNLGLGLREADGLRGPVDQGVHEGSRAGLALPNDHGNQDRVLLQADGLRMIQGQGRRSEHLGQGDSGQVQGAGIALQHGIEGGARALHPGDALLRPPGLPAEPEGARNLMGPLHVPVQALPMEIPGQSFQGPVVVPTMGATGGPEVELLPAERDHGFSFDAALSWTQRRLDGLMRSTENVQDGRPNRDEVGSGGIRAHGTADQHGGGSNGSDLAEAELERIRQNCLREAELRFQTEIRRLRGEEVASYHTATSGENQALNSRSQMAMGEPSGLQAGARGSTRITPAGDQGGSWGVPGNVGEEVRQQVGTSGQPIGTPAPLRTEPQGTPDLGHRGPPDSAARGVDLWSGQWSQDRSHGNGGHRAEHLPQMGQAPVPQGVMERPPGLPAMYGEAVRGTDLPALPLLGGDQAPLLFGDWLTLVAPAMYDLSQGSRQWWDQVIHEVEDLYARWLQASPLQRLRLRPQEGTIPQQLLRVEMKGVTMLLQVLPEPVKKDIVASRTLSSANILFKLYTLYQPGGGSEKAGLLKQIVEPKIPHGANDLLMGLRQWRRWISRAQELGLSLPDPTIMATVLGRFADSLSKSGGHQMSFRISAARQELALDHRPTIGSTRDFAEYLQAEAEELSLLNGVKGSAQPVQPPVNPTPTPAVKALNGGQGIADQGELKYHKAPCRFWKSDEGCRKGAECTYLHDTTDMKGRCFGCGSTNHVKKECPVKKVQDPALKTDKVKKIQKPRAEKGEKLEKGGKPTSSTSSTVTTEKQDIKKENQDGASSIPRDQPEVTQGTPISATEELLKEAADLLKSLKVQSMKAVRLKSVGEGVYGAPGEFALLDGGATNALRKAREDEAEFMVPTTVELAHGTTTLYRVPGHQTLLSRTDVEPIIPLGWLVQGGYHIDWGREKCIIQHPERGPLRCELRAGCPVMQREAGLALLDDLEKGRLGRQIPTTGTSARWWMQNFPDLPQRLLQWTEGQDQTWKSLGTLPWNRHRRRRLWKSRGVIVHLFAGQDHRPWEAWQQKGYEVLCLDVKKGGDLHNPAVWAFLWELASSNKVIGVIGGPPCRTVSRLRMRRPGPVPLRGRKPEERWGLAGLAPSDTQKTDYDSMLLMKHVALWKRAEECRVQPEPTLFLLESPEDPANYLTPELADEMPSFWQFPELQDLQREPGFNLISFDQGTMGHRRCKPTSLLCNVPQLQELNGMRMNGRTKDPLPEALEDTIKESESWAKWAPGLVQAIIQAVSSTLDGGTAQTSCKRLDTEGFKKHIQNHHIPFRRDCRHCMEAMGQSEPHRRTKLDGAAYCLSLDLAGPFPLGRDEGFNKRTKAKYILVGTVAIPKLEREGQSEELLPGKDREAEGEDPHKVPGELEGPDPEENLPEEEEAIDEVSEDDVKKLNERWVQKAKELSTTVGLQQVTMLEVLETRHTKDVVPAVGRLYAKMKAYGIPIHRVHSDRERCFITNSFRDFCLNRSLFQTMTSGDTPQENGRVESEICQIKRRLRLMLIESKLPKANWPNIARWVGEQRFRLQVSQLGIPTKPMIAPGTKVMVKQKLWNKKMGALSNPYKRMTLLGPSPLMSSGWVVKDGHKIQHARVVVQESPHSEAARLELEEALPRRLHGKQPPRPDQPRLPQPVDSNQDETDLENFVPPEDVPEVEYEPESPLPEDDEVPALHALQAGGESMESTLKSAHRGEFLECENCGLMQPGPGRSCGFCSMPSSFGSAAAPCSMPSSSGSAAASGCISSSSGLAPLSCPTTTRSGLAAMASSMSRSSGLAAEELTAEVNLGTVDPGELIEQIRMEHWAWKHLWNRELSRTVIGAEPAAHHGEHLEFLEDVLMDLEEELSGYDQREVNHQEKLKAMAVSTEENGMTVHPVLQTYTVGLAEVRGNMVEWEGAIRKELTSLFETTKALRRTTVEELASMPGSDQMEQAPMKLVATVKAPDGRRKARLVLCGNMIQSASGAPVTASRDSLGSPLYAGGLDGVALRSVLRKAAACEWSIASTDVRTAFLLAPRQSSRLLVVRPPQLLVDHHLATKNERWVVDHAVYGLETSPKDWGGYRDSEVARMSWSSQGYRHRFAMSTEPNLWKILQAPILEDGTVDEDAETSAGILVTYVDDLLALGPQDVVAGALACVRAKWECSPEEWVSDRAWMKFCGMELRWKGDQLLIGQPSYARELVNRHGSQTPRSTPAPKVDPEVIEEEKTAEQVKQAQQVVGELLWLAVRTRPDISYVVSWMGRHVAKAPKMVCQVAEHVIGYLQGTLDYALVYEKCPLEGEGSLSEIVALSDASHAPGGGRGCQGILVTWGGAAIQWEAKAQPFAALSSTEAELIGYVDAMTMGESLGAIVTAIEGDRMTERGRYRLKGDNLSGLQLLVAPDGPWRTRHLRLRSYVLRERISAGDWVAEHVPGAQLSVDLLTKPIVVTASWGDFRRAIGLMEFKDEVKNTAKMEKLSGCLEGLVALSKVFAASGVSSVAKAASAIGLSTLVACIHQESCVERGEKLTTSEKDLKRARSNATIGPEAVITRVEAPGRGDIEKTTGPWKANLKTCQKKSRENEPDTGIAEAHQEAQVPDKVRIQALRLGPPSGRSESAALYQAMEPPRPFNFYPLTKPEMIRPPPSGRDRWERIDARWMVRWHREWRQKSFQPVTSKAPVPGNQLEEIRYTVVFYRDERGEWIRHYFEDLWQGPPQYYNNRQEWIGFTLFKVREEFVNQPVVATPARGSMGSQEGGDQQIIPQGYIRGGARSRAQAAGPIVLRGSIARAFPDGVLQSVNTIDNRAAGRDVVRPSQVPPTSGAYTPSVAHGGEVPYHAEEGLRRPEGLHGDEGEGRVAESETATSDAVTEYIREESPAQDPTDVDPYQYMLSHVVDTVEDMMWQSGADLPRPGDPAPASDGTAYQNGRRPHVAALRPFVGQAFQAGLYVPTPSTEDDTMSQPGEAITRLLDVNGAAGDRLGAPEGAGDRPEEPQGPQEPIRRRRVPAHHRDWVPPPDGGRNVEILSNPSVTESDDGFELLLQQWGLNDWARPAHALEQILNVFLSEWRTRWFEIWMVVPMEQGGVRMNCCYSCGSPFIFWVWRRLAWPPATSD